MIVFLLLLLFTCPDCKPKGKVATDIYFTDVEGNLRTQASIGDTLYVNVEICNKPVSKPGNLLTTTITFAFPSGIAMIDSIPLFESIPFLSPQECDTFQYRFEIISEYWVDELFLVSATGDDSCKNLTSDLATELLIEVVPVSCHAWNGESLIQQYIKLPTNQKVSNGESYTIEVSCSGSIQETITGHLGEMNYTSTLGNAGLLNGAVGDFCNGCSFVGNISNYSGCQTRIKIGGIICESESEYHEAIIP